MAPSDFLTPEQVREKLGISEATYFRWLREKRLRGSRAGRNWRFDRDHVEQLLAEGTSAGDVRKDVAAAVEIYKPLLIKRGLKKGEVETMSKSKDGAALVRMMLEHAAARQAET